MSDHAASPRFGTPGTTSELREATREMTGYWWLWLIGGIAWNLVNVVIVIWLFQRSRRTPAPTALNAPPVRQACSDTA